MSAKELLQTYLSSIQNAAAAAALFADDGIIELPTVNARAQGPVAIQRFLTGLLAKVPDFRFENLRIWIDTPDRVFGEYDAQGHVVDGSTILLCGHPDADVLWTVAKDNAITGFAVAQVANGVPIGED